MTFSYFIRPHLVGAAEIRIHQVQIITQRNVIWQHTGQTGTDDVTAAAGWRAARVPIPSWNGGAEDFSVRYNSTVSTQQLFDSRNCNIPYMYLASRF